jgi:hypothetical protein
MNEMKAVAAAVGMAVLGSGCAAMMSGGSLTIDPVEIATRQEREAQQKKDEAARAEQQKKDEAARAEQKKRDELADAEMKKQYEEQKKKREAARAELEALAKTMKTVKVPELGMSLRVPGDVEVKPHHSDAYGTPAMLLSGEVSGFGVIVSNAAEDRYDFTQRLARHRSEFRYGIDVIRQNQGAGGTFEFEFSYPVYYNDGTRGGNQMGYFARKNVSGKKVNCFISGLSDRGISRVVEACKTVATAK